jgi:O-antigen/teichoic acid export membrane protein
MAGRLRGHLSEPLHRTAWGLASSTLVTSALGVGFWALAARIYPVGALGRDSALIASMMTISMLSQLNLGNVILRFLPLVGDRAGRRVGQAYALAAAAGALAAGAFVVLAPRLDAKLAFLGSDTAIAWVFVVAVALWSLFALEEAVLTSLGRAWWLPLENGLFGVVKVALLPLTMILATRYGIFLAWVLPLSVSVPLVNGLIAARVLPHIRNHAPARGVLDSFGRSGLAAFVTQDFVGTAALQLLVAAVPLVVLTRRGPAAAGYFFVPFTLATTLDRLSIGVAMALTSEVARTPARARALARAAVTRFLLLGAPVAAALVLAAPLVLLPFGAGYVYHGTTLLRLLFAASWFRAITFLYLSVMRLQGRGRRIMFPQAATAATAIAAVALFSGPWGLTGAGAAWLGTFALAAALLLPALRAFVAEPRLPELREPAALADRA